MNRRRVVCILSAAIVVLSVVAHASAQYSDPNGGRGRSLPANGAIVGTAWNHDDSPVSRARVRLRDVSTGRLASGVQADEAGTFSFDPVVPGSYLVEVVDADGDVLATGQILSVARGETVATFVRLPGERRWLAGFFSNAAAAALASAASLGVTAVGNGVQPASPRF